MERIRLDMQPKGMPSVCHASQYDEGRVIGFDLVDGLQGFKLNGDETLELRVRKPDNNIVTAAVTNTSSTYIEIVTTEQMTACEGDSNCEIRIKKDGVNIGTLNFILRVEEDPLKDGIESETEIYNLETQIQDIAEDIVPPIVAEEVANQYDSENVIFDDHPTPGHGTGYAVTSEGVKHALDEKPDDLSDLGDVEISSPTSNQALVYDPDTGKWVNGEVSTVGSIDDLDDVDTTGKSEGDNLRYDGNEWVAKPNTIEMTLAEWEAIADKQAWRNAHKNTYLVISDAPNLNATANDLSMGSAPYASGTVGEAITDLNKPTALTISGVPTGVTSNSKAYKLSDGLILIMIEVTFSSASTSWQNAFDIAWSGNTPTNAFGAISNDSDSNTYAQAYWNTNKITVRVSSPKATLYRGQIIMPC